MSDQTHTVLRDARFLCAICGKPTLMCCSACKSVFYCSEAHQVQHWEAHAADCIYSEPTSTIISRDPDSGEDKLDLDGVPENSLIADDELYIERIKKRKEILKLLCEDKISQAISMGRVFFQRVLNEYERNRFYDIYDVLADGIILSKAYIGSGDLNEGRQVLLQLYSKMCSHSSTHNANPASIFKLDEAKGEKLGLSYAQMRKKLGVYSALAALFSACGDLIHAEKMYIQYVKVVEAALGPNTLEASNCYYMIALFYTEIKQLDKAIASFRRSEELRTELLGPEHETVADCVYNTALLYKQKGNIFKATSNLQRALNIRVKNSSDCSLPVAQVYEVMAKIHMLNKDYKPAFEKLSHCFSIRKRLLRHKPDHDDINRATLLLAHLQHLIQQESQQNQLKLEMTNTNPMQTPNISPTRLVQKEYSLLNIEPHPVSKSPASSIRRSSKASSISDNLDIVSEEHRSVKTNETPLESDIEEEHSPNISPGWSLNLKQVTSKIPPPPPLPTIHFAKSK